MKSILSVGLAFLLCSCSSMTPERINFLATLAGEIAATGTAEWLRTHPDQRQAFDAVMTGLGALMRAGITNTAAITTVMTNLPTATLKGKSGELYVSEPHLIIWDSSAGKAIVIKGAATGPVVKAAVRGMRQGMTPKPTLPQKVNKPRRILTPP